LQLRSLTSERLPEPLLMQMRMIAANNQTTTMEELEKILKELKEFATPQEEQQYQPTRPHQCSQGLNHQPMSTHGVNHGSSHICSRGWHCPASIGGKALGPVKAHFLNVR